jgi:glycolate oxidase FAD binding subunit
MLLPESEEELAALIRTAAAEKRPVHTFGSRTKQHVGSAPAEGATAIGTGALARIVAYEPGDMVVTVQPGVRLADLQRTLGERRQWLPIDPPHADATIGGILATASTGARRLGYGHPRDHVLGMRVVNAAGTVTKSGGTVVKNVTGFDLHKLQVGAMGTLGVIAEVNLKVAALPVVRAAFLVPCANLAGAHRALLDVWGSALRPVALEALAGSAAGAVAPWTKAPAVAIVGVDGPRSFVDRHVRELVPPLLPATPARVEGADAERLWQALQTAPTAWTDRVVVRVAARPQDLPRLLAELAPAPDAAIIQAATGVARLVLPGATTAGDAAASVAAWHARAVALDGYAVVESAPVGLGGRDALPWNPLPSDLVTSLRNRWDPDRILNRGRMTP